jgi:hypothetical protein
VGIYLTKKQSQLISFGGMLIVFLTFVTKDKLESKWKENAEAEGLARYFYLVRADTAAEEGRFETIQQQFYDLNTRPKLEWIDPDDRAIMTRSDRDHYRIREIKLGARIETISLLAEKMKDKEERMRRLNQLSTDLKEAWSDLNGSFDELLESIDFDYQMHLRKSAAAKLKLKSYWEESREGGAPKSPNYELQASNIYRANFGRVSTQIDGFSNETLLAAKERRESDERRAAAADSASTVLYVLGWTLSLVGRLHGSSETEMV